MNRRKVLTIAVLASAAFVLALGIAATQPTASAAPPAKVDLCHRTGNGGYQPISVSANAAGNHMAHGDVQQPNGAVPGSPGFVFDSQCNAVTWTYYVNAAPDIAAQDPASPGNLFVGSGIPAENFGLARNEALGIELGLMILYRQGPTVPSTDNYADGVLNFSVASGPQSISNGSAVNNPGRAAWNFTFSVATGLNGATTDLGDYTFQLLYDTDAGPGTNYRTLTLEQELTPQAAGQSGYQWRDQVLNYVPIADDEGNGNVTQNSQNYAFAHFQAFLGGAYAPPTFAGPGQFDIILRALDGTQIVASNHIVVNVAP
ncbi:MAG TPA: hypothetical protein VFX97_03455 [Pyrinomonadaceae bacterium]|nr:hypothetical protein [Pyrinomonadaceae bacterium]